MNIIVNLNQSISNPRLGRFLGPYRRAKLETLEANSKKSYRIWSKIYKKCGNQNPHLKTECNQTKVATTQKKMKKAMTIFGAVISIALMLTRCGGGSNNNKVETKKDDTIKYITDTLKVIDTSKTEAKEEIKPANVLVKIFFRTRDMSGYEGYEDYKPETSERDEFRKKNKYTFCYDSEEFNSLQISGTGEKLTLVIKDEDKVIFSKSEFDVKDKMKFTTKDFNLDMGATYTIILSHNEEPLFKGIIDSDGCM